MIYWNSLNDFLLMGGYGLYVWGSFAVTALVFIIEISQIRRQRKLALAGLQDELHALPKN